MADTAVGLFENASIADAVVDSLRTSGFPVSGIRVVSAAKIPGTDFATTHTKDMRALGASEYESDAYFAAVNRGSVLVYATGSKQQANEAVDIMNQNGALEIEEFATASAAASKSKEPIRTTDLGTVNPESRLPESIVTPGQHENSYTSHASRSKTEGARVFAW